MRTIHGVPPQRGSVTDTPIPTETEQRRIRAAQLAASEAERVANGAKIAAARARGRRRDVASTDQAVAAGKVGGEVGAKGFSEAR